MNLLLNPIFALFVIITLGFLVGNIKIAGFSFDVSAVIFVALVFGHFGVIMPPEIERIGMVLFIFTVGIQAGPGFIDSFKKYGRKFALLASLIVFIGFAVATGLMYVFKVDSSLVAGLLCGALTSTPGLTVAIDASSSPLASIGYGIAYPFGVIGVILFIKLLPKIMKVDVIKENARVEREQKESFPIIINDFFMVENDSAVGKSLSELMVRNMTGATISRVQHNDLCFTPKHSTILHKGDIIRAVGTQKALEMVEILIGKRSSEVIALSSDYEVEQILITNKQIVGQNLNEISLYQNYNAVVTRIRRSGIDIAPSPNLMVRFGDKLTIAAPKDAFSNLRTFLGNNNKMLSDTDFFPIALGIVLGILVGYIEVSFSEYFTLGLGLSGGILIMAILLSSIGKTGPIIWTMSGSANQLLRQMGLLFFLAGVGTKAGAHLVETVLAYGPMLFLFGLAITIVPMLVAVILNKYFFKLNLFELVGTISGGMTSTPGLAACDSLTSSNIPGKAYASVYPIAMVVLIVFVQILVRLTF
ncbi:MAG: TrkA C-terminal domain-containing protein [Bacteroidales bacterium]|nr:TrkA C-terminal domain-containing protein [Bacteroidales bacterium]MDD3891010.1 TrkA C-terminal domain-containing protein [Bacteroidales bacterium]